eukprot:4098417-Pyramimonas_sp.AAC.1
MIENLRWSRVWSEPELHGLVRNGYAAEVDQCMHGLISERGVAHRKPTRFLASHEELLVDLDR